MITLTAITLSHAFTSLALHPILFRLPPTSRRLANESQCLYGYERGLNPFGERCSECLAHAYVLTTLHRPEDWGTCSSGEWLECNGRYQSPIDIATEKAFTPGAGMTMLNYSYAPDSDRTIINTGHNLEVVLSPDAGKVMHEGREYSALQFHFHLLSEHTVDDFHYDGEMHIVHAAYSEEGDMDSLLVVGIFFQVAGEMDNEFLETIRFEQAPTSATTDTGTSIPADVDLNYFADILDGEFWRYKGSLTTPACSEIVEWHVMKAAATMSRSQFAYFQSIFPDPSNYRPVQPLNGRHILDTAVALSVGEACIEGADLCGAGFGCFNGVCARESCTYGYQPGLDPLGEPCGECLSPGEWGSCPTGEWSACNGKYQSPIDIVSNAAFVPANGMKTLNYSYAPDSDREIINTGHNLEVELSTAAGRVIHRGRDYSALQFHFHLLSEHTVDGTYYDGEMHIVHGTYDAAGTLEGYLVVGIFFTIDGDTDNEFLETIRWEEAPTDKTTGSGTPIQNDVDLNYFSTILDGEFWRYKGSLTTPSCDEIVEWHVMKTPSTMSQSQYDYFQSIFPNPSNYRPIQPLNGRNVLDSADSLSSGESCIEGADLCDTGLGCFNGTCTQASCKYGYETSLDPFGHPCEECLAPSEWALCPNGEWDACDGMYQSPIDIVTSVALIPSAGKGALAYTYAPDSGREIINTGHNLEVVLSNAAGKVTHKGLDYIALQFHFHLLSEHTIDGLYYDGEMHIVHAAYNAAGYVEGLLVVGIFFTVDGDNDNEFLESIRWEDAPTTETFGSGTMIPDDVDLNYFSNILDGEFWRYKGSLTTPTCAEIVEWHVMKTPSIMSQSQYDYFQSIFPNPSNYRPIQPLNGRNILDSAVSLSVAEACVEGADLCGMGLTCQNRACAEIECHYGYEAGLDPFGHPCDDCLAPSEWASCPNGEWEACDGQFQSPIDIVTSIAHTPAAGTTRLNFSYAPDSDREIINTGHNLEVVLSSTAGKVTHAGRDYVAQQFHFHLLSEHTVDGAYYDGEMHIVHGARDADGNLDALLVVGILFNIDDSDNEFLESIRWEDAPTTETTALGTSIPDDVDLNFFADILNGEFWRYKGSLTTPSCDEIVEWHVMKTPSTMSQSQFDYFQSIFPNPSNYRPVQPLNGRNILDSAVSLAAGESCVEGADLCDAGLICDDGFCSMGCKYGYETDLDAFGLPCGDCLAPSEWGSCSTGEWDACDGMYQSPINIISAAASSPAGGTDLLAYSYAPDSGREIINTGHNLEVVLSNAAGKVIHTGRDYVALQFHFHLLSEHTVDGAYYDGEMHIVHGTYDSTGNLDGLLVVGIFFEVDGDSDNEFLETIRWEAAPTTETHGSGTKIRDDVDLNYFSDILNDEFWRYKGSLTTPPCTEIVEWHVMKKASTMSQSQYDYFQSIFPNPSNYRPVQRLNSRNVLDSAVSLGSNESCVDGADLCGKDLTCYQGVCTEIHCHYGYEAGLDPFGQPCADCLAPTEWASCPTGEWDACNGIYQSPINIVTSDAFTPTAGSTAIDFSYAPDSDREIINTGHNFEVILSNAAGKVRYEERDYIALQFHFHLLSEHTVDGAYYDGEMHIVHAAYDTACNVESLLVVGILFNIDGDRDNEFLETIRWEQAPTAETTGSGTAIPDDVDLNYFSDILSGEFWRYKGSLTTPPCSETVEWHVMKTPSTMSQSQYEYFQSIFPNPSNYRPVQRLNARNILDSAVSLGSADSCVEGADLCGLGLSCYHGICTHIECHYGYEAGRDAFGLPCDNCLEPSEWGSCLSGEWSACNGEYQSPIDIMTSVSFVPSAGVTTLAYSYVPDSGREIINTGHNLEVVLSNEAGKVVHNGRDYVALQFHFHLLSEHTVDGFHYDGEMHIVHGALDASGTVESLLVVGIFFFVSGEEDNEFLEMIRWEQAPTEETTVSGTQIEDDVDLNYFEDILNGEFWRYKGSLTTPSCDEIVEWHVMKTASPMSRSQFEYFQSIFPNPSNYRPVQPLNGRNILDSAVSLSLGESCVEGADLCGLNLYCQSGSCAETKCHYGYEDGLDAFGQRCDECLAPSDWGSCHTGEWVECNGIYQSPIDIVPSVAFIPSVGKTTLAFSYTPDSGREIINTGHNLEVVLSNTAGKVVHRGREYTALQFHFHLLSEHTVDGANYDGEMHIVHAAYDALGDVEGLLVIGIFFNIDGDTDNAFLETIRWEDAPIVESDGAGTPIPDDVDLNYFSDILNGEFWRYKGSLTTPPCSEIVEWHVMKIPSTMSQSQYDYFQSIFPNPSNYRPVQPLNGRNILDSAVSLSTGEACVEGADLCGLGLFCQSGSCTEIECHYGYEEGLDPFGEPCHDCLAPKEWGSCASGEWEACDSIYQSPINVVTAVAFTPLGGTTTLAYAYAPDSGREIINTGHNLEVVLSSAAGKVVHERRDYIALQFHFHLLSEHTVDGAYYDGEMHIVHGKFDTAGNLEGLLVVGIFFNIDGDKDNDFLETIRWEEAPTTETTGKGTAIPDDVDLNYFSEILSGEFWRYKGSLTTPPCTEIVEWHVMKTPSTMSQSQFDYFESIFPNPSNYRPVQPLNGRNILDSAASVSSGERCIQGADLCGASLTCNEGICISATQEPPPVINKSKKSGVTRTAYRNAIVTTAIVVFFGTGCLVYAFFKFRMSTEPDPDGGSRPKTKEVAGPEKDDELEFMEKNCNFPDGDDVSIAG